MDFEFNEVDSLDKVPEQFRGIYTESNDGKFVVGDNHKGVVEAVNGLNKSLKAARAEAKAKTQIDLSPLSDFGKTPEEIKTAFATKQKELEDQIAGKSGEAKLNLDKIREEMAASHSKELDKAKIREGALQNQLYGLLVKNNATSALVEEKGDVELMMPFVENQVKVIEEDGKFTAYVVDASGDRRYSGITGQPMTVKELVQEMKANEKYGRLFESDNQDGGGGMPPGGGNRAPKAKGRVLSSNEKIAAGLNKGQYKSRRS